MSDTSEKKYRKYDGTLFNLSTVACGVLVKESVMRRIEGLSTKFLNEAKTILKNESEKGNVFPYMWTLVYPEGEQTTVTCIDESRTVDDAIKGACLQYQPRACKLVFISPSMNDAKEQAEAYYKEIAQPKDTHL